MRKLEQRSLGEALEAEQFEGFQHGSHAPGQA
jgi:hypothetical protein